MRQFDLSPGDIIYVENYSDYAECDPDGHYSGEWSLIEDVTDCRNPQLICFGIGRVTYDELVAWLKTESKKVGAKRGLIGVSEIVKLDDAEIESRLAPLRRMG